MLSNSWQTSTAAHRPGGLRRHDSQGFTLVELMVVVVIMGVLLAVAYPSYLNSIRKSRRADAVQALTALQQAQERFRANNTKYGNVNTPADALTLPSSSIPSARHYVLGVSGNDETGYTATATATGGQAADTTCGVMGVKGTGGNLRYGSGTTSIDWTASDPDAGRCWTK